MSASPTSCFRTLRDSMSTEMTITQWHVPVDDETATVCDLHQLQPAVDKQRCWRSALELYELPRLQIAQERGNILRLRSDEQVNRLIPAGRRHHVTTSGRW